jgi:hypothetical protein
MDLANLIGIRPDLPRLRKDLDELGPAGRLWAVRQWRRATMAALWEAAQGAKPMRLSDLVPPSVAPLVEVIHDGSNSLPMFTSFQKRFCKPAGSQAVEQSADDPGALLFGYNHQSMMALTGPGYFLVRPSVASDGELEIDHAGRPTAKATNWPALRPNSGTLGWLVYDARVDVVRGVSAQVCIGRGRKENRWLDEWFVLVRRER